ncbi:glycosyltransferase [Streptomyces sp. NPDC002896]|uniref:glycosyltransferase n=1 Tax=Streptomyces sp. NPDC002896 TaxID=3154438 RepID=UPI00332F1C0A
MKRFTAGPSMPAISSRETAAENPAALGDYGVDPACSLHIPAAEMLSGDWIPIRRTAGGVLIATADELPHRSTVSEWFPGEELVFRKAGRREIQELIVDMRLDEVADDMANEFTRRSPEYAARTGIRPWQKAAACALALVVAGLLLAQGLAVVVTVISVLFCLGLLFKVFLAMVSSKRPPEAAENREISDDELPTYTILVPAYQEEAVIGETVRWLADMDYPKDKLEILVLVERRDEATARAVREVSPPDFIRIVPLAPGLPQTKPRSCNLGLMLARGELLVIFDAEDRPERDQLRKVAQQFAAGGDRLACVQAKLNYYNERRNPLTRLFSLEYAFWFDLMLPGLARLKLPIPLGGTSNHIRTDVLRRVGGWDAWNVTEDADLGLRLASAGHRVDIADSTTWEECPSVPWAWIMQRTRWLKGYLLTGLVYTRRPVNAFRQFGLAGMVSLLGIVFGTPVVFMFWPCAFLLALAGWAGIHADGLSAQTAAVTATAMWISATIMAAAMLVAAYRRRMSWWTAAIVPFYWLLHAFAGWRGLLQLIRAPYKWEKTSHGAPSSGVDGPAGRQGVTRRP